MSRTAGAAIHPAAWIVWASCAGFAAFVTTDPVYLLLLVSVAWFVHAGAPRTSTSARSFRVFIVAALVAVVLRTALAFLGALVPSIGAVTASTIAFAFLEGLRLGAILVVFGTFNGVTDPFGLVRMAPRRFHEPALAAALALSIAPRTIASAGDVREAQRLRGLPVSGLRSLPSLAVPVLERGMEEASTLAESMDARGHGRGTRSRYRPQGWSVGAIAIVVTSIVAAGIFLGASIGGWGGLHPATSPIGWPAADPRLLTAIALLATPGLVRTEARP
ncbi:MAG TPA: energy-coupling factor transporter transmembrane component T [Actinomycetota bacterium]|nr:energy-coupling factor transporter transmembrane component T [Actinomycetota bacterium]